MNRFYGPMRWMMPCVMTVLLLSACAANHVPPRPIAQTSPVLGRAATGTVVSVRNVDLINDNGAVQSVLTALGEPVRPVPGPAVEIVIRRQDASVTSIIQSTGPGQPSFAPGEAVAIDEAAATVVRPE